MQENRISGSVSIFESGGDQNACNTETNTCIHLAVEYPDGDDKNLEYVKKLAQGILKELTLVLSA